MSIRENIHTLNISLKDAAERCGRNPEDITLVAVSKRFPATFILEAIEAGHTIFGENYIQEAEQKIEEIGGKASFHFIGHLQSNKAKIAAALFDVVETVDSLKLANGLNKHLEKLDRRMKILVQVNVGSDPNKAGIEPSQAEQLLRDIQPLDHIDVVGLMTMPPLTLTAEEARPHFKALSELKEDLEQKGLFAPNEKVELSMGMSSDYRVAIEEGATIIRIGTAIFGERS